MSELTDIVSIDPLEPICLEPFDPDEVFRLWNVDRGQNQSKDTIRGPAGRGRGRGGKGLFLLGLL